MVGAVEGNGLISLDNLWEPLFTREHRLHLTKTLQTTKTNGFRLVKFN